MSAPNKALFLDRDGVINVEKGYVHRIEQFQFMPGIFKLCRTAQALRFKLVVITNQAGIGRGYYSETTFRQLTLWMLTRFAEAGVTIDKVYHCPYHPTAGIGPYRQDSPDRKPNPGMILKAARALDLDLNRSVLVGDKESDLQAGQRAGVAHNLLLVAGHPEPEQKRFGTLDQITAWMQSRFLP